MISNCFYCIGSLVYLSLWASASLSPIESKTYLETMIHLIGVFPKVVCMLLRYCNREDIIGESMGSFLYFLIDRLKRTIFVTRSKRFKSTSSSSGFILNMVMAPTLQIEKQWPHNGQF